MAIQKYLFVNKSKWKLIDMDEFEEMHTALDNIIKQRVVAKIGLHKKDWGSHLFRAGVQRNW